MSKEGRKNALLGEMFQQTFEHMHELKSLAGNTNIKESDVERWVQSMLRSVLGYSASNGYSIRAQEGKRTRPDLVIYFNEKPIIVVEIKKLGFDLNKSNFRSGKTQLKEYLLSFEGTRWGILSNGLDWKIFDFESGNGLEILEISIPVSDAAIPTIDISKRATQDLCANLVLVHAHSFMRNEWNNLAKEAMVFSPEALAKSILSKDVMRTIAKCIRGNHNYRAQNEILFDRVFGLLKYGLNDSVPQWNESKENELLKYIKAQKKDAINKTSDHTANIQSENPPKATIPPLLPQA